METDSPTTSAAESRKAVGVAALAILTLIVAGALSILVVGPFRLQDASIFYVQFARIEPLNLALVAVFAILALIGVVISRPDSRDVDRPRDAKVSRQRRIWVGISIMALAALAVALAGTFVVFHRFFLADDEYSAWFQAVIFSHGQRTVAVSPEWCRWIASITPTSISVPAPCTWTLSFLPIHSIVRSAFLALRVDALEGPVVAAVSIALVAAIARRAWPGRSERAWTAAAVLATSSTFLFTSMTMWSMPTHLLFDLVWIWLYVENETWSIALLPIVGFLSLGAHSPIPHLLLVPAFFLRYLRQRRWGVLLYLCAAYAVACLFWMHQLGGASSASAPALATVSATAGAARGIISLPSRRQAFTTAMHLSLALTWNSPLAGLAALAAMLSWKRLDTFGRDLALSLLCVLFVRAFGNEPVQGEGWGYRYMYNALGNFALLAACGADILVEALGWRRARSLALASLAATLAFQIPQRARGIETIIGPYRRASEWLATLPQQIVIFPAERVMWGRQLVRNDPFLSKGNILMDEDQLKASDIAELQRLHPGQVRVVTLHELTSFGLDAVPMHVGGILIIPN